MAVEIPRNAMEGMDPYTPPAVSKSIAEILEEARSHFTRLSPESASKALQSPSPPAVLVDIRPLQQRQREGEIPGATIIERNVLEWRFDPRSDTKLEFAGRYDLRVIVFCSEGYTSSLAARALQELGLWNATDIIGGYKAWAAAGLGGVEPPGPSFGVSG
jgi:rhodanese-related sulfurtransferase